MVFVLLNKNQILHRKQKKKMMGVNIYISVFKNELHLSNRRDARREGEKTDDDICDVILGFFHLIFNIIWYNIYINIYNKKYTNSF